MAFNCDKISAQNVKNKNDRTISVSELEDLGDDALGMQLLVESHEATYFGVLNHLLKDQYRTCIWLEKISIPKSGDQRLFGLKKFYLPNILSIKIVGMDLDIQKRLLQEIGAENKNLQSLILKKPACSENMEASEFMDKTNYDPQNSKSEIMFSDLIQQIFSDVPVYKNIQRPTNLKIIDTNGPEFQEAATHIYLYMQEHKNQVPYLIRSLSSLLREYFGFSSSILSHMFPEIVDESVWLERPLSNALQNMLAFSVMFLRELRQCLLDLILVNMQQLTNIFVNSFNGKTTIELQRASCR